MHVTYGTEVEHQAKLKLGLQKLGKSFVAQLCWKCDGLTKAPFEPCSICGKGRYYGSSLGLLIGNEPAPESVVNQVLVAAEQS